MGTPILVTGAAGRVGGVGGGGEASRSEGAHNMSQMTRSQMSITEITPSPQHKLQWLAEQVLNWSGLPVVHVRPTVFSLLDSVKNLNQIRLPFGDGKTSPVAAEDVARVVAALLAAAHRQD